MMRNVDPLRLACCAAGGLLLCVAVACGREDVAAGGVSMARARDGVNGVTLTEPQQGAYFGLTSLPHFEGQASPDAGVQIEVDKFSGYSTQKISVTAGGDGKFGGVVIGLIDDGSYVITASVSGSTTPPIGFVVDHTPPGKPEVREPADKAIVNVAKPQLRGKAEPGSTVSIFFDAKQVGVTKADASAQWTFTPPEAISDGMHAVFVRATDVAGNTSDPSDAVTFGVRSSGCSASGGGIGGLAWLVVLATWAGARRRAVRRRGAGCALLLAGTLGCNVDPGQGVEGAPFSAGEGMQGASSTVQTTITYPLPGDALKDTPTFMGTAPQGAAVKLYIDMASKANAVGQAGSDGTWVVTLSNALSEGSHSAYAESVTDSGQHTITGILGFVLDQTRPDAPVIEEPRPSEAVTSAKVTVRGTAEKGCTVSISVDSNSLGTVIADGQGEWSITSDPLVNGTHSVVVQATDAAGNASVESTVQFSVSATAGLGCSASGGALGDWAWGLLGIGAAAAARRRRGVTAA